VNVSDEEITELIHTFFDDNFDALRLEAGYRLSPDAKEIALQQVLLYWRRLKDIATTVTDTEVRLNLPDQTTPAGRTFGIEGVVDIVRDNDRTIMYDIKTHEASFIRANLEPYEKQLNVYAYIWHHLRGQPLDETAVISTDFPESIREALITSNEAKLARELDQWDPVVQVPFDLDRVQTTIQDFGNVVDKIEEGHYAPPPVSKLQAPLPGGRSPFGREICRNCDARFSCSSYRTYALGTTSRSTADFRRYYTDYGTDLERDERAVLSLDIAPPIESFAQPGQ